MDRFESDVVMVDFIRYLTKDLPRVDSNYRLTNEGDNSDNGHFSIDIEKEIEEFKRNLEIKNR